MNIVLNGEKLQSSEFNLQKFLELQSLPLEKIAVDINGNLVPRNKWKETNITDGDVIEIIQFVGGG